MLPAVVAPAFLGPVMPVKSETNRVIGCRLMFVQGDGQTTQFSYEDVATARKERQKLLKASNVFPVPTVRLLTAISRAMRLAYLKDKMGCPGVVRDDRGDNEGTLP